MKKGDVYRCGSMLVTILELSGEHVVFDRYGGRKKRLRRTFLKDFKPVDMKLHKKRRLVVTDIDYAGIHSDAGRHGLAFLCPVCREQLTWGPHAWWDMTCECGRQWSVKIEAAGVKE